MLKKWTQYEIEYLNINYQNKSVLQLANELNRTCKSIESKAVKLGLKKPRIKTNIDYFDEIDTEEKAYWLGFIFADGYVSDQSFGLELGAVDVNHLHKLKKSLDSESKISLRTRKSGVKMCYFRVYNKEFVNKLITNGVVYNKTFVINFPNLKKELNRHFIRGFIDGDGYVMLNKRKSYGYDIRTGFVCGNLNFVKQIVDILNDELKLSNGRYIYTQKENNHYYATTNRKDALLVLDYLYKDSTIYLDRKYEKYLSILEFTKKDKIA